MFSFHVVWTLFSVLQPREDAITVEGTHAIRCDDLHALEEWVFTYDAHLVSGKVAFKDTILPDISLRGFFWEDLEWRWN